MRIILDDHELDSISGGAGEALESARQACESQGRIITDVFLDDRRLDGPDLDALTADNPAGQVLRCNSTDPLNLVAETFEYVSEALDQVSTSHEAIAEHFQAGRMAEGLSELKEALTLWNSVRQGVEQGCLLIGLDIEQWRTEETAVNQALTSLASGLEEIRRAISKQDWSSLADTLGYEMQPVVDDWQAFVRLLTERVESLHGEGGAG